jgi:hypothetical protein
MLFQPLADSQARLLLLLGRTKEADEQLQARLEWQRAWGCRNPGWTSTRSLAALAARALGKASEARTLATENLEAAQAFAAPREIGIALRTMAIGAAERTNPVATGVGFSAGVIGGEARASRTLVELGAALRRSDARRDSRAPLRSATRARPRVRWQTRSRAGTDRAPRERRSPTASARDGTGHTDGE